MIKKFFFKLVLFSPLLFILVGVNYFGDAGNIFYYSNMPQYSAEALLQNKTIRVSNFDHRELQKNIIGNLKSPPSLVVFGSSKAREIGRSFFPELTVFNHFIPSATLEDYVGLLGLYHKRGFYPKTVIIGLDPWILNARNGLNQLPTPLTEAYFQIDTNPRKPLIFFYNFSRNYSKWIQLIDPSYFLDSFKRLVALLGPNTESAVIYPDGTRYSRQETLRDPGFADSLARTYINGVPAGMDQFTQLDPEYIRHFNLLISFTKSHDIKLIFVLLPFHPLVSDFFNSHSEYAMILKSEMFFYKVSNANNIAIFGSFDPLKVNFNSRDFYDGTHPKKDALLRLFKKNELVFLRHVPK